MICGDKADMWPQNFEGQGHLSLKIANVKHIVNIGIFSLTNRAIFKIFVLNELELQAGYVTLKFWRSRSLKSKNKLR